MEYVYAHLPQGEDIGFEERSYRVTEKLLDHQGRKVLYLLVEAADVTFCDRSYAMYLASVNVKGYVVRWKYETNEKSDALSEIEAIENEEEQREIGDILRTVNNVSTVSFMW